MRNNSTPSNNKTTDRSILADHRSVVRSTPIPSGSINLKEAVL